MRGQNFTNRRLRRISQNALDVLNRHVDRAKNGYDLSHLALRDRVIAISRLWVNECRLQEPNLSW